jgi:hypothetical protein
VQAKKASVIGLLCKGSFSQKTEFFRCNIGSPSLLTLDPPFSSWCGYSSQMKFPGIVKVPCTWITADFNGYGLLGAKMVKSKRFFLPVVPRFEASWLPLYFVARHNACIERIQNTALHPDSVDSDIPQHFPKPWIA